MEEKESHDSRANRLIQELVRKCNENWQGKRKDFGQKEVYELIKQINKEIEEYEYEQRADKRQNHFDC